jgi:hypothetical protein
MAFFESLRGERLWMIPATAVGLQVLMVALVQAYSAVAPRVGITPGLRNSTDNLLMGLFLFAVCSAPLVALATGISCLSRRERSARAIRCAWFASCVCFLSPAVWVALLFLVVLPNLSR